MPNQPRPANRILTSLPDDEFEQLRPKLRPVNFPIGEIIYMPEQKIEHVYFVNRGVVSLLAALEDGATVEAGVIGPEGLAGVSVVLGANSTPNQSLTQSDVETSRIRPPISWLSFAKAENSTRFYASFRAYDVYPGDPRQPRNRLHTLDQRLARWLLTQDRVNDKQFTLTQEFLSHARRAPGRRQRPLMNSDSQD
jgi:hypothetical protein